MQAPKPYYLRKEDRYWPLNGRNYVKSVIYKCIQCFKARPPNMKTKMGDLPPVRLTPTRPFLAIGIDFAGPFHIKDGTLKSRKTVKTCICIFICLVTKAIHIELVNDLSTHAFLNSLKRFDARRGLCSSIYCDNATNFIGAKIEFSKNIKTLIHSGNSKLFIKQ